MRCFLERHFLRPQQRRKENGQTKRSPASPCIRNQFRCSHAGVGRSWGQPFRSGSSGVSSGPSGVSGATSVSSPRSSRSPGQRLDRGSRPPCRNSHSSECGCTPAGGIFDAGSGLFAAAGVLLAARRSVPGWAGGISAAGFCLCQADQSVVVLLRPACRVLPVCAAMFRGMDPGFPPASRLMLPRHGPVTGDHPSVAIESFAGACFIESSGRVTTTTVPSPGWLSICIVPPIEPRRSRMLNSP